MDDQAALRTYGNTELPEGTADHPLLNYVFVYENMNEYGGIQSILIRLSAYLSELGHKVTLANVRGKLLDGEGIKARIIPHQEKGVHRVIAEKIKDYPLDSTIILGFSPSSAAVGYMTAREVTRRFGKSVKFGVGIFHPRDFFLDHEKWHVHRLNHMLSIFLGGRQFIFMNNACRTSHERFFRRNLPDSLIAPVPIDRRQRAWKPTFRDDIRICSVGRIVPFKAYNFSAPEIANELLEAGFSITWDIFGHGSHEDDLVDLINHVTDSKVRFRGALPLKDFDKTVSQYDVFVGVGTAALQAAQLGVPTVLAADQEPHRTYGFLHDVPFGNLGELERDVPASTIFKELKKFCEMTAAERLSLSIRDEAAASKYDIEIFVSRLNELPRFENNFFSMIGNAYCSVYLWTMRDSVVRRAYRLVTRGRWSRRLLS